VRQQIPPSLCRTNRNSLLKNGSVTPFSSCSNVTGLISISDNSCQGFEACSRMKDDIEIGSRACIGDKSCYKVYHYARIGNSSCSGGGYSCGSFYKDGGRLIIGPYSCNETR
jgi:hypothetical protein